jgi:alpha-mannosidase
LQVEIMVHRRIQTDDHRGVQEPLNETMCGCNDINASPGSMGEHGHEGDGGCECAGLTMRGSVYVVFDTIEESHAVRRQLIEALNFPPTLAFTKSPLKTPTFSGVSQALPANVKLMTLVSATPPLHRFPLLALVSISLCYSLLRAHFSDILNFVSSE